MFSEGALRSKVSPKQSFEYFILLFKTKTKVKYRFHLVLYQQVEKLLEGGFSPKKDLSLLAVRKEDIFLNFISEAKISDDLAQINLGKP